MRKKYIIIGSIFIFILVFLYYYIPAFVTSMVTDYDPYTFEMVFSDHRMKSDYGIQENRDPGDYGYNFEEVNFHSLDDIRLNGWYIPAKRPSSQSILFVHGRTSNRLKPMKYLALVDSLGLDTLYNVFIPDLRNSGRSEPSKTYMGYKFADDIVASLLFLHKNYHQESALIYGFSMGAMATVNAITRKDLKAIYSHRITVDKVILDSPLANVKETIRDQAAEMWFGTLIFEKTFDYYSRQIDDFGDDMRLSKLIDPDIPTLILQSKDDKLTKVAFLEKEISLLSTLFNTKVIYFSGPGHVRMFQSERSRSKYLIEVANFIYQK